MISNIRSIKHCGLLKGSFLLAFILSLALSACGGKTPVRPTATLPAASLTPSVATLEASTPTEGAELFLPSDTPEGGLEQLLPTDEPFPTDETGVEAFPTDEPFPTDETGLDALPTDQGIRPIPTAKITNQTPNPAGSPPVLPTSRPAARSPLQATEFPPPEGTSLGEFPSEPTRVVEFKPTPAGVPLGDPANPIMMGVVSGPGADPAILDSSDQLAAQLTQDTGYTIQVLPVNTYVELLNGMQLGSIHMAWLQPFTYILASFRGYARVALVTNHFGVFAYGAQFLANTRSGFISFYDSNTGKSTGTAEEALAQFAEKRPCYVDPLSASGYIVPAGLLAKQNLTTLPPVFMLSHTAVVRSLYVMGICDFGVTFSTYGDPRTASSVQEDLTDVMQKVVVVWQTDSIIPNLNLSFQPSIPADASKKIASALSDMMLGEDGKQLLASALNYDVQDVKAVDDSFYDPLREVVKASRVNLKTLVGK